MSFIIILNNNLLPNSIKYLGITIDKRLTWKKTYKKEKKTM